MKKKIVSLLLCAPLFITLCAGCATSEAAAQTTEQVIEAQDAEAISVEIPGGVMANSTWPDLIRIRWNKVAGASGYEVYRTTGENGEYNMIATEPESPEKVVMSILDKDIEVGKEVYYKIRAFMDDGDKTVYSEYSSITSCHTKPAAVTGIAASGSIDGIAVKWDEIECAGGYEIARSTEADGEYAVVAESEMAGYADNQAEQGPVYFYKVRAYIVASGENEETGNRIYGGYSKVISAALIMETENAEASSKPDAMEYRNRSSCGPMRNWKGNMK